MQESKKAREYLKVPTCFLITYAFDAEILLSYLQSIK